MATYGSSVQPTAESGINLQGTLASNPQYGLLTNQPTVNKSVDVVGNPIPTPAPVLTQPNVITGGEAKNDAVSKQDTLQGFLDQQTLELANQKAELAAKTEQAIAANEQRIKGDYEGKQRNLAAQQGEESATSKALQFKLGREATLYADAEKQKLNQAHLGQVQDLTNQMNALIAQSNKAIRDEDYRKARDLQSDANDTWNKLLQINQEKRAQEAADLAKETTKLQNQKTQQEIVEKNLDTYASGFIEFDDLGNVTTADPADVERFAQESGIPYEQIVGAIRNKAYELGKMSQEDRKRELDILNAQRNLIPTMYQDYDEAVRRGEWSPEMGTALDYAAAKEAAGENPLDLEKKRLEILKLQKDISSTEMNPRETQNFLAISNKFQADSIMQAGNKGAAAIEIANDVIKNPGSAGNQLKILYTLVKNLDPDSAVREGELSLASQTQSYFDKFKTSFDRLSKGKLLSETATKELAEATKDLAQNWFDAAERREKQYVSQANVAGVGEAFDEYLKGFEQVYKDEGYKTLEDFTANASDDEVAEFEKLRTQMPDSTPQDLWEFYQEEKGFNEPLSVGKNSAQQIAAAIKQVESGGNYNAKGASTEGGAYQFMPATWKSWAKQYLGNENAPMTPANQDKVALSKINDLLKQGYGAKEIALIWNGGQPIVKKGVNKYGVPYDSGAYANKVLKQLS